MPRLKFVKNAFKPATTLKLSRFHLVLWGIAILVLGTSLGLKFAIPESVDTGYFGLPAQSSGEFVDQSFSRILDEAFRSNQVFEHPEVPNELLIVVASESCAPSREALLLLASRDPGTPILIAHQGASNNWIEELNTEMKPAPQHLSDLIFSTLPRVATPTLIAVSQRTVVSFGMGSHWVAAHYGSPK